MYIYLLEFDLEPLAFFNIVLAGGLLLVDEMTHPVEGAPTQDLCVLLDEALLGLRLLHYGAPCLQPDVRLGDHFVRLGLGHKAF